jgi:hypothetical protein
MRVIVATITSLLILWICGTPSDANATPSSKGFGDEQVSTRHVHPAKQVVHNIVDKA